MSTEALQLRQTAPTKRSTRDVSQGATSQSWRLATPCDSNDLLQLFPLSFLQLCTCLVGLFAALSQVRAELQRRNIALAVAHQQYGVSRVECNAREPRLLDALQPQCGKKIVMKRRVAILLQRPAVAAQSRRLVPSMQRCVSLLDDVAFIVLVSPSNMPALGLRQAQRMTGIRSPSVRTTAAACSAPDQTHAPCPRPSQPQKLYCCMVPRPHRPLLRRHQSSAAAPAAVQHPRPAQAWHTMARGAAVNRAHSV